MSQYYILVNGNPVGPMDATQMLAYHPNPDTPVSTDGAAFKPLYTYPELMARLNQQPYGATQNRSNDSQRIVFGVLALLIGCLGIQYFIVGKTTAGILNIVISFVTCGLWGIVNFVQGIIVLCMSDEQFNAKFVNSTSTFPIF